MTDDIKKMSKDELLEFIKEQLPDFGFDSDLKVKALRKLVIQELDAQKDTSKSEDESSEDNKSDDTPEEESTKDPKEEVAKKEEVKDYIITKDDEREEVHFFPKTGKSISYMK